jgi:hypothetical protein
MRAVEDAGVLSSAVGFVIFTAVYVITDPRTIPAPGRALAGGCAGRAVTAAVRYHGYYPKALYSGCWPPTWRLRRLIASPFLCAGGDKKRWKKSIQNISARVYCCIETGGPYNVTEKAESGELKNKKLKDILDTEIQQEARGEPQEDCSVAFVGFRADP